MSAVRTEVAAAVALALTAGCGGRTGAQIASARLVTDLHAPPTKCLAYPSPPIPKEHAHARASALASIGRAVGAPEHDEPIVFDALAREVKAVSELGACMPTYKDAPDGAVSYEMRCATRDPRAKARADRLERLVREEGTKLLRSSTGLEKCRFDGSLTKMYFGYAARGSLAAGKVTHTSAGCSWADATTCDKACEAGLAEACSIAAGREKDPDKQRALFLRGCDLALDDPKASPADLSSRCAAHAVDTSAPGVERSRRFADRACVTGDAVACWFLLDSKRAGYRPEIARTFAARVDCAGDKPCPLAPLLDPEAPHYDAARAARLTARVDELCAARDKQCFVRAGAWRLFPPEVGKRAVTAVVAECDDKGPNAGYACPLALAMILRGEPTEDLPKAQVLAARLCDDNAAMCATAGDCTEKGTCSPAPDRAAARAYHERACALLVKLDPKKPRDAWAACKRADELAGAP